MIAVYINDCYINEASFRSKFFHGKSKALLDRAAAVAITQSYLDCLIIVVFLAMSTLILIYVVACVRGTVVIINISSQF